MKKIMNTFWKPTIILPLLTLFCLAGFIGSYVFPNTVLDTYVINMTEEGDDAQVQLPLSLQSPIVYEMNTGGLPMQGIQVGINKRGYALENTILEYTVYADGVCVSTNFYAVAEGDDLQYVFLPFAHSQQCIGQLRISFILTAAEEEPKAYPVLMANHAKIENTATIVENLPLGEEATALSLKCSYIYSHDTYPFLYDFRILTFIFLAASMTVTYPKRKKKEEDSHAD